MPKWKYTLNLKDFWEDDTVTVPEKAKRTAESLKRLLSKFEDEDDYYELEEIYERFKGFS